MTNRITCQGAQCIASVWGVASDPNNGVFELAKLRQNPKNILLQYVNREAVNKYIGISMQSVLIS